MRDAEFRLEQMEQQMKALKKDLLASMRRTQAILNGYTEMYLRGYEAGREDERRENDAIDCPFVRSKGGR